jgi:hypothetical protein
MRLISRLLRVTRFRRAVALISALKSCFGPPAETVGLVRYWRQKASPVLRSLRASVLIIIQFARTDFVTIIATAVLRSRSPRSSNRGGILFRYNEYPSAPSPPPPIPPRPLSFLRGGISNFCRILLVSTFSALGYNGHCAYRVRNARRERGVPKKIPLSSRKFFSPPLSLSLSLVLFLFFFLFFLFFFFVQTRARIMKFCPGIRSRGAALIRTRGRAAGNLCSARSFCGNAR